MLKKSIKYLILINTISLTLNAQSLYNKTAYITSQCYTKTVDDNNQKHNPCYSCHTKNKEPNFTFEDDDLQESYAFPASALKNPWTNLFKDRTKDVAKISDKQILKYVNENNYNDKNNQIILKQKLQKIQWRGYIPDCEFSFDKDGFDRKNNTEYTLWRAFAYYPFLGTFWPTNGSTDDVLIRLAKEFSLDKNGQFDLETYKLNLSIVESLIKQKSIKIDVVDENKYQVDLNQNGKLDKANSIVFKWETPSYDIKNNRFYNYTMSYVGMAKTKLELGKTNIAPGLYPVWTEFLHSVRYLSIDSNNNVKMASRMKELRYAKKTRWFNYSQLKSIGINTLKEKYDFPDRTEQYLGDSEIGLNTKRGWYYQGFIEDKEGELRAQNYEETLYCMGCHSNLGATIDSTFVFGRKFEKDIVQNSWYHWSQKGFKNIPDKKLENNETEYTKYLKNNNSGDEFRTNDEVKKKFFKDGILIKKSIDILKKDISYLLIPSVKRAIQLNKAYKVIVDEQSFIYGRDAHIKPTINVHKKLTDNQSTHLEKKD